VLNEIEPNPGDFDVCNVSNAYTGPYRIDVFAADVTDVVTCAGGWLYDQSARGWRVTAAVADSTDPRPLRILGVHVVDLGSPLPPAEPGGCVLGVGSEDPDSDCEIQRLVLRNLRKIPTKVRWWGGELPPDLDFFTAALGMPSARQRVLSNNRPSTLRAPLLWLTLPPKSSGVV
jgi:hypothetical protein